MAGIILLILSALGDAALILKGNRKLGLCLLVILAFSILIINILFFVYVICRRETFRCDFALEMVCAISVAELAVALGYCCLRIYKHLKIKSNG